MSLLIHGPKESPDFNLRYRFVEAIAAADDPRYVADMLLAFYGPELDPHVQVNVDIAARAEGVFRCWRPPSRSLRRWAPGELVGQLATANVFHAAPSRPSARSARSNRAGGGAR